MQGSANLNVMVQAARKAGRGLVKDFREVENLQVSSKGAGDFVSRADLRAEETVREMLMKARPNYGWLGEESEAPFFGTSVTSSRRRPSPVRSGHAGKADIRAVPGRPAL